MPKEADVRKAFEAVVGRDLPADIGDEVVLRETTAVSTVVQDASITSREIGTTGSSSKACRSTAAFDVGGTSRTAADGTAKFS